MICSPSLEEDVPIQTYLHEGFFTQDQEKTYVHLPFEMPVGATRLDVEYQYSDRISSEPGLEGGNTIDLGVFDEGGIDFLTAGFRGWSGSERPAYFIAEEEAAPGYLAGRLNPGKWHVLLGLYKIGPQGCSYKVSIRITTRGDQKGMRSSLRACCFGGAASFWVLPTLCRYFLLAARLHCPPGTVMVSWAAGW
jgi:hypothetical protein